MQYMSREQYDRVSSADARPLRIGLVVFLLVVAGIALAYVLA